MFITKQSITPSWFLVMLIFSTVVLAGCFRSAAPETKPPEAPLVGVIDMDKAINAHPKYQEWQQLKRQAAQLRQQLEQLASPMQPQPDAAAAVNLDMAGTASAGLQAAAAQEFNANMAAKQQELQAKLTAKASELRGELSLQLKEYAQALEQEYQLPIFNQQLKMQTVRMDEQAAAEAKKTLDALKAEQADKLAAKEKELMQSLDKLMAPEQEAVEQELADYAQQLNTRLNAQTTAQTAELSAKTKQAALPTAPAAAGDTSQLEQQLSAKQQEIRVLEEYIVTDIRDKAAKIATERRLDTVLSGYQVNNTAVDITAEVIRAIKK